MPRRSRLVLPLTVALVAPGASCKKEVEPSGDDGTAAIDSPSDRGGPPPRLDPIKLKRLGDAPGFLADGPIYAAVRAGTAQDFLRQIPLPGDVTRELARARREIGFDPLVDDMLERFAIPEDAVISMTLGRPVGVASRKDVTTDIRRRDDRFLKLMARVITESDENHWGVKPEIARPSDFDPPPPPPPSKVEAKPIVFIPPPPPEKAVEAIAAEPPMEPPIEKPPIEEGVGGVVGGVIGGTLETPYDPTPPPISPGERREVEQLLRKSDGSALQFRFHIPTQEPKRIFDEFRAHSDASDRTNGEALCRDQKTDFCMAGGRGVLVGRSDGEAVILDLLLFTHRFNDEADPEVRRAAVAEAMKAAPAELDALEQMAGHASAYVDAEAMVEMVEHERTGAALRALSWDSDRPREGIDRRLREAESLRRMLAAPRLFDGLLANAHHERDRTQLQVTWPLREGQQALAIKSLAPPPMLVPVPSLDALCDGALVCARSRGLPRPEEIGTQLGQGIYGDARAFENAFNDADEAAAALLLVSTWPNGLGTLTWHLPLGESRGAEAALVRGALDAIGRIQGLGLSIRSLDVGRRSVQASYAAYARVPTSDIGLVNTALAFAEMRMNSTTVEGIEGEVTMLRFPDDDVPAVLMSRNDPEAVKDDDDKEIRHGWLSVVDDPKRLAWLLDLPTDEGTAPFAYAEIPDLWRLAATVPELVDELGFARTWATDRAFKTSLGLDGAELQLVMEIALSPAKPSEDSKD